MIRRGDPRRPRDRDGAWVVLGSAVILTDGIGFTDGVRAMSVPPRRPRWSSTDTPRQALDVAPPAAWSCGSVVRTDDTRVNRTNDPRPRPRCYIQCRQGMVKKVWEE